MNILHYTIGLPPRRHGGSVQYAFDLMREQSKKHNVFALTCGDTLFRGSKSKFKYQGYSGNIQVLSLTNPLTPTLIYGASEPDLQHRNISFDKDNIRKFISENAIEVMHLHTLQGIHYDIVAFIKSLGVKIVYTTHDFHGICPHYNLINYKGDLCAKASGRECAKCNLNEPSDKFLRVSNSSLYHFLKDIGAINILKKIVSSNPSGENPNESKELSVKDEVASKYDDLLEYYKSYFSIIDKFHFNSSQTKEVFISFFPKAKGEVINVITSGIKDKRKPLSPDSTIKLGFIGSLNDYKGFPLLKQSLIELAVEGIDNINLISYGSGEVGIDEECLLIEYKPPYKYRELSEILYSLDGIIVPSKWYETFSLVTLESLAHGRPAFVSNHVGAKDIVAIYGDDYIFSSKEQLKDLLRKISSDKSFLKNYSDRIMTNPWNFTIHRHADEIIKFYQQ